MEAARDAVQLAADVIREAVTCDRTECTPDQHHQFVTENLQIAADQVNDIDPGFNFVSNAHVLAANRFIRGCRSLSPVGRTAARPLAFPSANASTPRRR